MTVEEAVIELKIATHAAFGPMFVQAGSVTPEVHAFESLRLGDELAQVRARA